MSAMRTGGGKTAKAKPKSRAQTKSVQKAKQRPKTRGAAVKAAPRGAKKTAAPAKKAAAKPAAKKSAAKAAPNASKTAHAAPRAAHAAPNAAKAALNVAQLLPLMLQYSSADNSEVKRPPNNPSIGLDIIAQVFLSLDLILEKLKDYAAHLRTLDRKRLNKIGNKREGFAQRAFRAANDAPEFLPRYLDRQRYYEDYETFYTLESCSNKEKQVHDFLKDLLAEWDDIFYTDGLDYYASVREAAKRRVDPSESIYEDLHAFFTKKPNPDKPPTKKKALRDIKGYIDGKKEGIALVENIKPKAIEGVHKVIDEQIKDSAHLIEDKQGEFDE